MWVPSIFELSLSWNLIVDDAVGVAVRVEEGTIDEVGLDMEFDSLGTSTEIMVSVNTEDVEWDWWSDEAASDVVDFTSDSGFEETEEALKDESNVEWVSTSKELCESGVFEMESKSEELTAFEISWEELTIFEVTTVEEIGTDSKIEELAMLAVYVDDGVSIEIIVEEEVIDVAVLDFS